MTKPLSSAVFSAVLQKLGVEGPHPKIAVAVSGGGDSLALALLMQEWAGARGGALLALTVDHGLRPDSGAEAGAVQNLLRARGMTHEILTWEGEKPCTHVQEAARAARYRLLLRACRERGFPALALAHNLEDQIETFWMRLAHGSGLDGLSGMAPRREEEGITIIRPLLSFTRAQLRATCEHYKAAWIEDPSNKNEKYLRVRLRAFEDMLTEEGLTPQRLAQTLQKLEDARAALQAVTVSAAGRCLVLHDEGYATLKTQDWKKEPVDIQRRLLSRALQAVAPRDYAAGFDAVEDVRRALVDPAFAGRTLAGCEIFFQGGAVCVVREASAVEGRQPVQEDSLWDGRFSVTAAPAGVRVGALGEEGLSELRKNKKDSDILPFKIKKVLPALWDDAGLAAVPHLGYVRSNAFQGVRITFVKVV